MDVWKAKDIYGDPNNRLLKLLQQSYNELREVKADMQEMKSEIQEMKSEMQQVRRQ
jgi:hypothetical protein